MKEHPDLIFSDSCVQLFRIDDDIETYLGSDVLEIIHRTDPRICNGALGRLRIDLSILVFFSILIFLKHF